MLQGFPKFAVSGLLVVWLMSGCREPQSPAPQEASPAAAVKEPLRLLIVDDARLATAIPRQWQARADRELVVRQMTSEQLLALTSRRLGADVVIYPSGLMGELAARRVIVPVPDKSLQDEAFARRDLFELSRLREVSWGREVMAVSFGSPQFCLLFRRDWFERLQITPPTTWAAYQEVVARLADRKQVADLLPAEGQPWTPVIEPLGSGWRGQVLLARSAAYAQHRSQFSTLFDYRTMTPLIDGPPFVRALQELVETARHGPANAQQLGPAQVRREFLEGRAAMVLTWPSRADDQSGEGAPVAAAFAELPGSVEAYNFRTQSWDKRGDASDQRVTLAAMAGRLGSVTRESSEPLVAGNMLIWLTGRLSADVCTETEAGTLFRESHLPLVGRWIDRQFDEAAAKSYGEAVQQAQNRTAWLASVRIPGRPRYLAALDDAVAEALSGVPPADCLRKTAAEWDKITDAIGRESQRQAYMQSVGINP